MRRDEGDGFEEDQQIFHVWRIRDARSGFSGFEVLGGGERNLFGDFDGFAVLQIISKIFWGHENFRNKIIVSFFYFWIGINPIEIKFRDRREIEI